MVATSILQPTAAQTITAPPPFSRSLLPSELAHLHQHRYAVIPDFCAPWAIAQLKADVLAVNDCFDACKIGTDTAGDRRHDESVRRSRQASIIPPPPNHAGSVATRNALLDAVGRLRCELQSSSILRLPELAQFKTELNYLHYPVGGHYGRHLDTPYHDAGWQRLGRSASAGGSFSGARTRRVVSFILYLNRAWKAEDGGALRVFPPHEFGYGMPESQLSDDYTEDVLPEGGTLVLLMSSDVEHRVRETRADRQCVVGWFREYAELEEPDLAIDSLRTIRQLDRKATLKSVEGRAAQSGLYE